MASINVIKEVIMICRKARVALMIWGKHGLGKSSLCNQVALENQLGFVDKRVSQIEASDLRGLPDKLGGRTAFLPPEDMPYGGLTWDEYQKRVLAEKDPIEQNKLAILLQPQLNAGILLLDELFRGQDDVLQAAFELVYDFKVGQYVLPPEWSIVSANNFFEGYLTNSFMDDAFLDRFCHVTLSSGEQHTQEWVDYMIQTHGDKAAEIIEFCASSKECLYGPNKTYDMGFQITPTPRSWDLVARIRAACEEGDFSDEAKIEAMAGVVGRDMAVKYTKYNCPVKPRDVIDKGVKALKPKLLKLDRNQYFGLTYGLNSYLADGMDDKKHITIALDYAEYMLENTSEKDLITGFLTRLVTSGTNDRIKATRKAALANPRVAALINRAEKKVGKKNTLLQELENRPKLKDLVSKTVWGM